MYKPEDDIYVKETHRYGKSLFANRDFKKDETVFFAFGPIVYRPTTYTFPIGWGLWLDATAPEGNPVRYLCHTCEPNLGVKDRTRLVAFLDIRKGEEVAIDYAMIVPFYGKVVTDGERVCHCEKSACRGKWGAYDELSPELNTKYLGYISDYLLTERPHDFNY